MKGKKFVFIERLINRKNATLILVKRYDTWKEAEKKRCSMPKISFLVPNLAVADSVKITKLS